MSEKNIFVKLGIINQKVSDETGATVVEFAIILPLLMLLIFAIVEFALLFYNKTILTNAAREGARAGSVFRVDSTGAYNPISGDEIILVVNSYLANNLVTFSSSATSPPNPTPCPQDRGLPIREVTVEVPFTYTFLTLPNLMESSGFPLSIDLKSQSIMTCE